MTQPDRRRALADMATERILVVDGAMGTALQQVELTAADYGGEELEGCPEILVRTRPDVVEAIHRRYLEAGADIVETNSFGGTPVVLDEYGLGHESRALSREAAELARSVVDGYDDGGRPRFVAGSIGPTTRAISVTGGISWPELLDGFRLQALGLIEGGVDLLLVETQQDTRNAKAALLGIEAAAAELGHRVPVMLSGTIEPTGTMLAGQDAAAFYASVQHFDLFSIGLNCATGPAFMADSIRELSGLARTRVSCIPNAGLPNVDGEYEEGPEQLASALARFAREGWLNVVGGCCGTTPAHIAALAAAVEGLRPRAIVEHHRALYSGIELAEAEESNRPLLVGERTNVIGSRKFKRLVQAEDFEAASEVARLQAKAGAQVLDVCLADPDRDELADMDAFLAKVTRKVKLPLMIDSTDAAVIERALTWCQGRSIINSINLEDGEERFEEVVPLARQYGAALVVGTIDEDPDQGMAVTRQRKLEVARRSHGLLTGKYGLRDEDILFDPLVFPCATGDENYLGSAEETIEGVRLIKEHFPRCKTILGISNVSFGLPLAGREVLNAVFLYHCTKAGLDAAIVNTERLERFASIPAEEVKLAEDLLWNRGEDPIAAFAAHFRERSPRDHRPAAELPLDERLARYIVEGSRDGLEQDLASKMEEAAPLEIINGPLMAGMDEVGRLFNDNQLIVAEVLQSAEAMKAAVGFLEPHMDKADSASKGKVLLATVKGDVHDIGKNLVDIILSNNGYEVVNLGIKVPPERLVQAVREHQPMALGLSGLLVKSAQQMVITAEELRENGIDLPLLVGGAALSPTFTRGRIAPAYGAPTIYARDAMDGLALVDGVRKQGGPAVAAAQEAAAEGKEAAPRREAAPEGDRRSPDVRVDLPIPPVPDHARHVVEPPLPEVWELVNPQMLYGKHMGYRGRVAKGLREGDPKLVKLLSQMDALREECRAGLMHVRCLWQFFEAEGHGNELWLFAAPGDAEPAARVRLPRQRREGGLCLADYALPPREGQRDSVALMVTTAGEGILERSAEAKAAGEYVRSHGLQALAVETAEAAAEWLHRELRAAWGFPDPEDLAPLDLFRANYRGKRYSFGYPACPDLSGQEVLFDLLRPSDIGVALTEGHMMEPEASVSAMVFHHPDAKYYAVPEAVGA